MSETVSNTKDPKCWFRYNSKGGKYMTCNYKQEGSNYTRIRRGPKITPEQYTEQEGVDYSDMSKAQVNEYHRLDMIQRRKSKKPSEKKPRPAPKKPSPKKPSPKKPRPAPKKKKKKEEKKSRGEQMLDLYDGVIDKGLADAIHNARTGEYYSAIRFGSREDVAELKKQYAEEDSAIRAAGQNVPPKVNEPASVKHFD